MRPIRSPREGFGCLCQSQANPLPTLFKWYLAARRCRFARKGQIHAAAADSGFGLGRLPPAARDPGRGA